MFWLSRRGRTATRPGNTAAPATLTRGEPLLREVLKHERQYWAQTGTTVAVLFGMVLVLATTFAVTAHLVAALSTEREPIQLRLDISLETGLVALGILATLVIALQVSVRGMPEGDDRERALGRRVVLERLSLVAGIGAYSIFFAVLCHFSFEEWTRHLGSLVGLLAAATLVTVLAIDAASASSGALGAKLEALRARRSQARLRARLVLRLSSTSRFTPWPTAVSRGVSVLLIGSALGALPVAQIWGMPAPQTLVTAAACIAAASVITSTLVIFARVLSVRGQVGLSAYIWMVTIAIAGAVGGAIFALILASNPRPFVEQMLLGALTTFIFLVQVALLTGRVPTRHGGTRASIGHRIVTASLAAKIGSLRPKDATNGHPEKASAISSLVLFTSFIVPPVAVLMAQLQLTRGGSRATLARLTQARLVAIGLTVLMVAMVGSLVFRDSLV